MTSPSLFSRETDPPGLRLRLFRNEPYGQCFPWAAGSSTAITQAPDSSPQRTREENAVFLMMFIPFCYSSPNLPEISIFIFALRSGAGRVPLGVPRGERSEDRERIFLAGKNQRLSEGLPPAYP